MAATRDYILRLPKDFTVVEACETVRCENWQYGWETILDERTLLGRDAAAWIRSGASGRTYTEVPAAVVAVFRFEAGQRCFEEHRTKPARWLVHGGAVRQHASMRDWIDDLDEHVGRLNDRAKRG